MILITLREIVSPRYIASIQKTRDGFKENSIPKIYCKHSKDKG